MGNKLLGAGLLLGALSQCARTEPEIEQQKEAQSETTGIDPVSFGNTLFSEKAKALMAKIQDHNVATEAYTDNGGNLHETLSTVSGGKEYTQRRFTSLSTVDTTEADTFILTDKTGMLITVFYTKNGVESSSFCNIKFDGPSVSASCYDPALAEVLN